MYQNHCTYYGARRGNFELNISLLLYPSNDCITERWIFTVLAQNKRNKFLSFSNEWQYIHIYVYIYWCYIGECVQGSCMCNFVFVNLWDSDCVPVKRCLWMLLVAFGFDIQSVLFRVCLLLSEYIYVLNCNCKCYLVVGGKTQVLTIPLGSDVSGPSCPNTQWRYYSASPRFAI